MSLEPIDIKFVVKGNVDKEIDKIKKSIHGIDTTTKQAAGKANQNLGSIGKQGGKIGKMFSSGFASFLNPATLGISAITGTLLKIGKDAYNFSKEFDSAMLEVKTISSLTGEAFEDMSDSILKLSTMPIKDDAQGLSKAMYQIVSAGYDGAEGLAVLEASAKAATGGVTTTMTAADGLTTVMNAWGASVSEVDSISDKMFTTVKLGKTTMEELSSNIAKVAPLASSLGVSFDEVFAATASITKQGTPTAEAFTQMRAALTAMNNVLGDGWAQTMTFQEGLAKVRDMAGGSQQELKRLLGTDEAVLATLALTGEKAAGAAADLEAMGSSAGAASTAFEEMSKDVDIKWDQVSKKWKAMLDGTGDTLVQASSALADFLNAALTSVDGLGDEFDEIGESVNGFSERMKVLRNEGSGLVGSLLGATFSSDEKIQKIVDSEKAEVQQTKDIIASMQEEFMRLQESGASDEQLNKFREDLKNRYAAMLEATEEEAAEAQKKLKATKIGTLGAKFTPLVAFTGLITDKQQAALKDKKDEIDSFRELIGAVEGLRLPGEVESGDGIEPAEATVEQQIESLKIQLTDAKKELGEMRLFDSIATPKEIEEKEKIIKEFERQLEVLTGVSKKAGNDVDNGISGTIATLEKELKELQDKTTTFINPEQEAANLQAIREKTEELEEAWMRVRDAVAKSMNMDNIEGMKPMESKNVTSVTAIDPKPISDSLAPMKKMTAEEEKQLKATKEKLDAEREIEMKREVQRENMEELAGVLGDSAGIFDALAYTAGRFNKELADSLQSMAGIAADAGNFATQMASGMAGGGWIGAIQSGIGLLGTVIGEIQESYSASEESQEKINEKAQALNEVLRERIQLLVGAGLIDEIEGASNEIDNLNEKLELAKNSLVNYGHNFIDGNSRVFIKMDEMMQTVYGSDWGIEQLTEAMDDIDSFEQKFAEIAGLRTYIYHHMSEGLYYDEEALAETVNEIIRISNEIDEIEDKKIELTVGFSSDDITSGIVDGIMDGFQLAGDELGDFADSFQQLMEKAAANALTKTFNQNYLSDLMDEFEAAMDSDGKIDSDEMEALQKDYAAAVREMQDKAEAWAHVIGEQAEEAEEGLQGDIKGITQEQAGMLEGRMNAMHMKMIDLGDIQAKQLTALYAIESNTGELLPIVEDIEQLRQLQSRNNELLKKIADNSDNGGGFSI